MRTKLLWVAVGLLTVALCTVLAFATETTRQAQNLPQQELRTINLSAEKAVCNLTRSNGQPASYFSAYAQGMRTVTLMDPSVLCAAPQYPLQLNSFSFTLYTFSGAVWPVTVDVVVFGVAPTPTVCPGPGTELCRFTVTCDQVQFGYPNAGTVTFPTACCVKGPFYIGLEYVNPVGAVLPSILYDNTPFTDSCSNWMYYNSGTGFAWYEWFNFFSLPVPGYPIFSVSGETVSTACAQDSFYYKPGYPDYCPIGMPDFDQKQDFSWPPDGNIDPGYCGPAAVANCFWWFDSKFEPNPVPPPTYSDGYPLVQTYATMLPLWDDHDAQNAMPLISALGTSFNTNLSGPGTNINDMHAGIQAWLASRQLGDDYTVNRYDCQGLTWEFLAGEVKRSQDVILLVGFYVSNNGDPLNCYRIGGHYVTVAGVDSTNRKVAISDPFLDTHPAGASHNDAANVSHDIYDMIPMGPMMCEPHQGCLFLPGYPVTQVAYDFYGQNGGATAPPPPWNGPMWAIVEYAEIICPKQTTCEYYKAPYPDYAPNGMPDFDQKQDGWLGWNGGWSFCGPVAALNCLWWFDSKFETNTIPPPSVIDNYPLLQSMSPVMDDHDPLMAPNYVTALAPMMNCVPGGYGTNVNSMMVGIQQWIDAAGLHDNYQISLHPPSWPVIRDSVLHSQDLMLLLGFWQQDPSLPGECTRIGGHWVTVAGVCTTTTRICISDPYFDHVEGEPPAGSAHGSAVHNDARLVSGPHGSINHDVYNVGPGQFTCPTPIPLPLELTDYPDNFTDIIQFEQMNQPMMPPIVGPPVPGLPVYTMIEWVVMVCPKEALCDCTPGDADGNSMINITDAVYLIAYIFGGGPAPVPYAVCSGDADGNCMVNITDAVFLINYIFGGGAAPCDCKQWLINCGPPLR
jgi:hypothetical protein